MGPGEDNSRAQNNNKIHLQDIHSRHEFIYFNVCNQVFFDSPGVFFDHPMLSHTPISVGDR